MTTSMPSSRKCNKKKQKDGGYIGRKLSLFADTGNVKTDKPTTTKILIDQKNINQYTAVAPKCHCTLSTSTHCDWSRASRFGGSVKVATAGCFHPPAGEHRLLFSPFSLSDNLFSTVSGNGSGDRTSGDSKGIAFGVSPEAPEKGPVAGILSSWRDAGACFCSLVGAFPALGLTSLWAEPILLAVSIIGWLGICCRSPYTHKNVICMGSWITQKSCGIGIRS